MARKITSLSQIGGGTNPAARPAAGFIRPETKLGTKTTWPFPPKMTSTNAAARLVQGVIKDLKPKSKNLSPLEQLRRH